jgi:hypothetical protein
MYLLFDIILHLIPASCLLKEKLSDGVNLLVSIVAAELYRYGFIFKSLTVTLYTDPVTQTKQKQNKQKIKTCDLRHKIFCAFWDVLNQFSSNGQLNIFHSLIVRTNILHSPLNLL